MWWEFHSFFFFNLRSNTGNKTQQEETHGQKNKDIISLKHRQNKSLYWKKKITTTACHVPSNKCFEKNRTDKKPQPPHLPHETVTHSLQPATVPDDPSARLAHYLFGTTLGARPGVVLLPLLSPPSSTASADALFAAPTHFLTYISTCICTALYSYDVSTRLNPPFCPVYLPWGKVCFQVELKSLYVTSLS